MFDRHDDIPPLVPFVDIRVRLSGVIECKLRSITGLNSPASASLASNSRSAIDQSLQTVKVGLNYRF
jgi:hypothetical protein